MATNLVSLVMQFLTPNTISRIAAALGLEQNKVQAAIGAAVPGLLAGFSSVAAQPEGAQRLADAAKQQTSTFGSLADMIGGAGQSSLIDKGTQMLSSLLGGHDQTALAGGGWAVRGSRSERGRVATRDADSGRHGNDCQGGRRP